MKKNGKGYMDPDKMAKHDKRMVRITTLFFTLVVVIFIGTKLYQHHRQSVREENAYILAAEVTTTKKICNEYSGIRKIEFKKYVEFIGPGIEYLSVKVNNEHTFRYRVYSKNDVSGFGVADDEGIKKGETRMNDVQLVYTIERGKEW